MPESPESNAPEQRAAAEQHKVASTDSDFESLNAEPRLSLLSELWLFVVENRLWVLAPIIIALAVLGVLVVLSSTGLAPFIYTLF